MLNFLQLKCIVLKRVQPSAEVTVAVYVQTRHLNSIARGVMKQTMLLSYKVNNQREAVQQFSNLQLSHGEYASLIESMNDSCKL